MTEPVLSLRGLTVTLHRNGMGSRVLDGIDLDVAPGEIVALVGESGSGKSTIGLAVQGLLAAEAAPIVGGAIRLEGTELTAATAAEMRAVRRGKVRAVFRTRWARSTRR
jgi:peptide/nickel transport system ATP-binding protein